MKKRIILLLLLVILSTGCEKKKEDNSGSEKEPSQAAKENIYSDIYIKKINELNEEEPNLTYDLIYLNGDNVPELVVALNSYHISIYTIKNNSIYSVAENYPYGAFGNHGYEYIEKGNIICNRDTDYAGLIAYTSYYYMNENMNLELKYGDSLVEYYFDDKNNNGMPDENEYDETSIHLSKYMLGGRELTEEEYNNYMVEGNYIVIQGTKDKDEMIKTLESLK